MAKGKPKVSGSTKSSKAKKSASKRESEANKPSQFRVERSGEEWTLRYGSAQTTTASGKPIRHPARAMLLAMRQQLEERGGIRVEGTEIVEPRFVSFHAVFSIEQDWVAEGRDWSGARFPETPIWDSRTQCTEP